MEVPKIFLKLHQNFVQKFQSYNFPDSPSIYLLLFLKSFLFTKDICHLYLIHQYLTSLADNLMADIDNNFFKVNYQICITNECPIFYSSFINEYLSNQILYFTANKLCSL